MDGLPGMPEQIPIGKDAPGFAKRVFGGRPVGIGEEVSCPRGGCGDEFDNVIEGSFVVDAYVYGFRVGKGPNNRGNVRTGGGAPLSRYGVPLLDAFVGVF